MRIWRVQTNCFWNVNIFSMQPFRYELCTCIAWLKNTVTHVIGNIVKVGTKKIVLSPFIMRMILLQRHAKSFSSSHLFSSHLYSFNLSCSASTSARYSPSIVGVGANKFQVFCRRQWHTATHPGTADATFLNFTGPLNDTAGLHKIDYNEVKTLQSKVKLNQLPSFKFLLCPVIRVKIHNSRARFDENMRLHSKTNKTSKNTGWILFSVSVFIGKYFVAN